MFAAVARVIARLWWLKSYADPDGEPVPRDSPSLRTGADDPDRLLIVGGVEAGGRGVLTHQLGPAGQIARAVAQETGRPCDADYIGDEAMVIGSTPAWVGWRSLESVDAVVLMVGSTDAARRTPVPAWTAGLARALETVLDRTPPEVRVLVVGIEGVLSRSSLPGPLLRAARAHAVRLDAATRTLLDRTDRTAFVQLPAEVEGASTASALYRGWAAVVSGTLAAMVDGARRSPRRLPGERPVDAPADLRTAPGLAALVDRAKEEMRADLAWVSVLSGDRFLITATTSRTGPRSVPQDLAFCRVTAGADTTLVVPNRARDDRFRANPLLDVLHLQAYAGHPIRSAEGEVLGTFCVASLRPRSSSAFKEDVIRRFAEHAEAELLRAPAAQSDGTRVADPAGPRTPPVR